MLTAEYPSVMVPVYLKNEIRILANNQSKPATAGLLFRMLICSIIGSDEIWFNSTAKVLYEKYADQLASCQSNFNLFK